MSVKSPWLTAFKHAALLAIGVAVIGALLAGLDAFGTPEKMARATGSLAFWIFLATLGTSAALQHGRKRLGLALGLITALVVGLVSTLWLFAILRRPEQPVLLSAAEQQPLRASSDGLRLCSGTLGFSVAVLPQEFEAVPELQSLLNQQLATHKGFAWVFQNKTDGQRIVVQVIKGVGRKEATFRGFAKGVSKSAANQPQVVTDNERLAWSEQGGEYVLSLRSPEAEAIDFRCLAPAASGHRPPLIVCVQTISAESTALTSYRTGLALKGC